jgi:hypothetical protein
MSRPFASYQDFSDGLEGENPSFSEAFAEQGSEGKKEVNPPGNTDEQQPRSASTELLPTCHRYWQKRPLPLALGKRVQ